MLNAPLDDPDVPRWLQVTLRAFAVAVILPFRLIWEALRLIVRGASWLWRYLVVIPLGWLWHYLVAVPAAWIWRYLIATPAAWTWRYLIAIPAAWIWRYLIAVPAAWIWRYLIAIPATWLWRQVILPVLRPIGVALAWTAAQIHRFLLLPLWRYLVRPFLMLFVWGWRGTTWLFRQVYRWVLTPIGHAIAAAARFTHRWVLHPVAESFRWIHRELWRPAADAVRSVLGLRRGA